MKKYEKPEFEVLNFNFAEFMTGSTGGPCSGYTDSVGHTCGTYTPGSGCSSWSTPSFGGGSCGNYDGKKCYGYTDNTHSYCSEYGISCAKF